MYKMFLMQNLKAGWYARYDSPYIKNVIDRWTRIKWWYDVGRGGSMLSDTLASVLSMTCVLRNTGPLVMMRSLSSIFPSVSSTEFWIICFYNRTIFTSWFWKDTHVINPLCKHRPCRALDSSCVLCLRMITARVSGNKSFTPASKYFVLWGIH